MVHICNHDAESTVELRHGDGGGVPIVYHHHQDPERTQDPDP